MSTIVILPNDLEVEATGGGGGGGESEDIGLDYDYIWNVLTDLANVVHVAYEEDEIRKGRAFGTPGDDWTATYIEEVLETLDFENVQKIPLTTLESNSTDPIYISWLPWNCDLKVETIDFNLTINNPNWNFTDDGHIPKNETFVMPCAATNNRLFTPVYITT